MSVNVDTDVDVAVIGAGVVGLAIAAELGARGTRVCLLERHPRAGMETSTHNSGVIHAGIYYPKGSLKAQLCVEGAERMYAFCAAHDVPHERCGKVIVASENGELELLDTLRARGLANEMARQEIGDQAFVRAREPHVGARGALWSPDSGRVEAEALVRTLLRIAEADGAMLLRGARVVGGGTTPSGVEVQLERET